VSTTDLLDLSKFAPVPRSALGPVVNEPSTYQAAFLTTSGGSRRAVDEIASANGVSNKMNHRHIDTGGTE